MLTKVDVRNPEGSLLSLELTDISDGLIVEEVEGLDPVNASIVSSNNARRSGSQYQASRREERVITLKVAFKPDVANTVEDLRFRMYEYFMPDEAVKLTFHLDSGLEVDISGRVESCEAPLFAKEPVMEVVVICFDPDLVDPDDVVFAGETTDTSSVETLTLPRGTVRVGFVMVMNIDRTIDEFTIYHTAPDGKLRQLDFAYNMLNGDILTISTVEGDKYARLNRSGTVTSALNGVLPQSSWLELSRGNNDIRVYAEGDEIPYTLTYKHRYGGL